MISRHYYNSPKNDSRLTHNGFKQIIVFRLCHWRVQVVAASLEVLHGHRREFPRTRCSSPRSLGRSAPNIGSEPIRTHAKVQEDLRKTLHLLPNPLQCFLALLRDQRFHLRACCRTGHNHHYRGVPSHHCLSKVFYRGCPGHHYFRVQIPLLGCHCFQVQISLLGCLPHHEGDRTLHSLEEPQR